MEPADWCRLYETRAVVTPTNVAAAELNETMLQGLPVTAERIFLSHDSAVADAGEPDHYTPEFMNSLDLNGMPPHELRVRPGALMMILRNYAPQKGSTLKYSAFSIRSRTHNYPCMRKSRFHVTRQYEGAHGIIAICIGKRWERCARASRFQEGVAGCDIGKLERIEG